MDEDDEEEDDADEDDARVIDEPLALGPTGLSVFFPEEKEGFAAWTVG